MCFLQKTTSDFRLIVLFILVGIIIGGCSLLPSPPPPEIGEPRMVNPTSSIAPGNEVSVIIDVTSSEPVSYRWRTNEGEGEIIRDETSSAATWKAPSQAGTYNVFVEVMIDNEVTEKSVAVKVQPVVIAVATSTHTPTLTVAVPTSTPINTPTPIPPTPTPTPTHTRTPTPTDIPTPIPTDIPTPTPTNTPPPVDTPTPTCPLTATPGPELAIVCVRLKVGEEELVVEQQEQLIEMNSGDPLQILEIVYNSPSDGPPNDNFSSEAYIRKERTDPENFDWNDGRFAFGVPIQIGSHPLTPFVNDKGGSDAWIVESGWNRMVIVLVHNFGDNANVEARFFINLRIQ